MKKAIPFLVLAFGIVVVASTTFQGCGSDSNSSNNGNTDVSFQDDVLPIFASAGCTASSCHSSATAQGGLALQGSATTVYAEVTENSRVNTASPSNSLLLTKATNQVTHTGGAVLSGPGDDDYDTIVTWISEGAQNN